MAGRYQLLSANDIRIWELFDGLDETWPTWSFATKTALHELGWNPLMDIIEAAGDVISA